MSGTTERASIRLGTEDIDNARAKMENLGTVGDAALRKIATAGQAAANAFAGINQPMGGDGMRDRAADIAAYGLELDRLRAKFDPVFAASQRYEAGLSEIAEAERLGAINARVAGEARDRLNAAYTAAHAPMTAAAAGTAALGRVSENAAYQQKQLAFQLNDVFTSLTTGAPPLQVFLQQGGQITQIYGGVGATVRGVAAALGGPLVLGDPVADLFTQVDGAMDYFSGGHHGRSLVARSRAQYQAGVALIRRRLAGWAAPAAIAQHC